MIFQSLRSSSSRKNANAIISRFGALAIDTTVCHVAVLAHLMRPLCVYIMRTLIIGNKDERKRNNY